MPHYRIRFLKEHPSLRRRHAQMRWLCGDGWPLAIKRVTFEELDYDLSDKAIELILYESEAPEGILVSLRMARSVPLQRFVALREALEVVFSDSESWQTIDRTFAAAIHALSFHLEGLAATLRNKAKLPAEIDEELPMIYELIDEIFGT